jgi:hypothetical protein
MPAGACLAASTGIEAFPRLYSSNGFAVTGCKTKFFASPVGQSCRSALNLGGAAAPPCRRHEEFCPAPAVTSIAQKSLTLSFFRVDLGPGRRIVRGQADGKMEWS